MERLRAILRSRVTSTVPTAPRSRSDAEKLPVDLIRLVLWHCDALALSRLQIASSASRWAVLAREDRFWAEEADCLRARDGREPRPPRGAPPPLHREIGDAHARYLLALAAVAPPTAEQAVRFVAFVAGAHSWYKHLANGDALDVFQVLSHAGLYF